MAQYLPIFALLVLALVFGAISRVASRLLAPRNPSPAKSAPYECGIADSTESPERFPVTFFIVAMLFIVFDIEVIFLLPWATVFRDLGAYGLVLMVLFVAVVFESFVYLIGKGALDWGPIRQVLHRSGVTPVRTAETTIRRVGADGRPSAEPVAEPAAHTSDGEAA